MYVFDIALYKWEYTSQSASQGVLLGVFKVFIKIAILYKSHK